jgi:hypothetical protein
VRKWLWRRDAGELRIDCLQAVADDVGDSSGMVSDVGLHLEEYHGQRFLTIRVGGGLQGRQDEFGLVGDVRVDCWCFYVERRFILF